MRSTARTLRRPAGAAALIIAAMLVAACDEEESHTEADPVSLIPTAIVYQVRGTYPPWLHRVVINRGGRATITKRSALQPGRTRRRVVELPDNQLAKIKRELAAAHLSSTDREGPRTCQDCPIYTVEFGGERVELAAVRVPGRLQPAVRALKRALRSA